MRERTDGLIHNDAGMVEDFLELDGGFSALARGQVGLAANINRIQGGSTVSTRCRMSWFIGRRGTETFHGLRGTTRSPQTV